MKHIVVTRGDSQYLESMLNTRKVAHEIYKSIPLLESTYLNRDLRSEKLVIIDSIFDDVSNMFNDLERLHDLVITPYFRYEKLVFVLSDRQDIASTLEMINSIFEDVGDKLQVIRLNAPPTVLNIYNILLDKADTQEEIINRYEEVIKQKYSETGGNRLANEYLKIDSPGTVTISTVDVGQIMAYQSVLAHLSKNESAIKTVQTEYSSRSGLAEDAMDTIESIAPPEEKSKNKIVITGERSSGKFTFTTALMTSLFQNQQTALVYDLTDSNSFLNMKFTHIDHTLINVNELVGNKNKMAEDIQSLGEKMINVITGNSDYVYEYSHIINVLPGLHFDFVFYVVNATKLELIDFSKLKKIFAVTSDQPKFILSLSSLLADKLSDMNTDLDLSIVPMPIHSPSNDVLIPHELVDESLDTLYNAIASDKYELNITIMTPSIQITELNMEAKFAQDILGGGI